VTRAARGWLGESPDGKKGKIEDGKGEKLPDIVACGKKGGGTTMFSFLVGGGCRGTKEETTPKTKKSETREKNRPRLQRQEGAAGVSKGQIEIGAAKRKELRGKS